MAGEFLALFATLTFVISNVLFRKTEHDTSPILINAFRTLVGVFTFILIGWIGGALPYVFQLSWQLWLILILSFVFGQVIGDTSYFIAQKSLGTTKALAISMTYPLFAFLLSVIFLNEKFQWIIAFSFLSIASGVFIIAKVQLNKSEESTNVLKTKPLEKEEVIRDLPQPSKINRVPIENDEQKAEIVAISSQPPKSSYSPLKFSINSLNSPIWAIFFALLASLGWALGLVIIEYATNTINNLYHLDGMSSIVGNIIRFPFAFGILTVMLYSTEKAPIRSLSHKSVIWLIIGSIIGTSLGAYLYTEAARVAGATIMSLMASANPLFSVPLSYMVNREKISPWALLGVIFIIFGVVLILL